MACSIHGDVWCSCPKQYQRPSPAQLLEGIWAKLAALETRLKRVESALAETHHAHLLEPQRSPGWEAGEGS